VVAAKAVQRETRGALLARVTFDETNTA
jgi:hypothetical protein